VEATDKIINGAAKAGLQLGGNLMRFLPKHRLLKPAWRKLSLMVMITTKRNRSHLVYSRAGYHLPCLSRIKIDWQASEAQTVLVEDTASYISLSRGMREPTSALPLSKPAIARESHVPIAKTIPIRMRRAIAVKWSAHGGD
jgi:hypothetical protein